ncbi:hypothetical protein OUZ56_029064 [Daphnia magna]|uniref:Uncharacterized protein n=1 Tax=Daphnia magna TaxID=35525 RepID=A0ABR0B5S1_9CRUS|nr:hypothetical protein OUZ56_029064 [Daphnia magna]
MPRVASSIQDNILCRSKPFRKNEAVLGQASFHQHKREIGLLLTIDRWHSVRNSGQGRTDRVRSFRLAQPVRI